MSYQKRKGVTVEDVAYGIKKNQIFMNSTPGQMNPAELAALAGATSLIGANTEFEIENNKRIAYNEKIKEMDPRFALLEPLGMFLVRYKVRTEEKRAKLIVPTSGNILLPSRSGKHQETVKDPYRFSQVAVIVAVPKYETDLKPGMLVHCNSPKPFGNIDDGVLGYDCEYMHPDYQGEYGTKDVQDQNFGYAIVERGRIKVIINEPETQAQSETVSE